MNSGQIMLALATHATELPLSLIFLSDVFSVWWKKPLQLHFAIYFNNHLSCKCLKFKTTADYALEGGKERREEGKEVGRKKRWPQRAADLKEIEGEQTFFGWAWFLTDQSLYTLKGRQDERVETDNEKKRKEKWRGGSAPGGGGGERGMKAKRIVKDRKSAEGLLSLSEETWDTVWQEPGQGLYCQWATSLCSVPSCPSSSFYPRLDFCIFISSSSLTCLPVLRLLLVSSSILPTTFETNWDHVHVNNTKVCCVCFTFT